MTNGNEFVMPNVSNWTRSEIISFAKLLNIEYEINGYGNVVKTNINEGELIDLNGRLIIDLEG